jgi:2-hydroxy-3-keto-5-methylthiopentenyl-1-phosphate phosphatase
LRHAGWEIVVTSAGCEWYIRKLLTAAGVELLVHANSGRFLAGSGLLMKMPEESPFRSESLGVDKTAVVRHYVERGGKVAFAGDGFPDADAARLVPAHLRFARADLADVLRREQLAFHPFETWSDIARTLLSP